MDGYNASSRSKLHTAARDLAAKGIRVFPARPGEKRPAIKNWPNDASADPVHIDRWWGAEPNNNIGMVPEHNGWCVPDIDVKSNGEASLVTLETEHGKLPETLTVRTPSGGRHLYFTGSLPATQGALGPGIDTRGRLSYVLVPPSQIGGKEYEVIRDGTIAPVPGWIVEKLRKAETPARSAAPDAKIDSPLAISRAREVIAKHPIAGEFEEGDDYTLVARCKDIGVSPEKLLELLIERGASKADRDWLESTLIANVWRYGQNQAGSDYRDPAERLAKMLPPPDSDDAFFAKFMDVAGNASEREINLSKSVDYDAYLFSNAPAPALAVLFEGMVGRGHFIPISGPGGVHKSRLCAQLTLALRYARGLLRLADKRARDSVVDWVEYLSYENSAAEDHRRLKAMAKAAGLEQFSSVAPAKIHQVKEQGQPPLLIVPETPDPDVYLTKAGRQMLRRWSTMPGHKVIILDSLFNAVQFQGKTKVSDAHADQVIRIFDHWCEQLDATILSPFHPSRAGAARGDLGHSSRFEDAPRQVLMIEEETKQAQGRRKPTGIFSLRVKKWNDGQQGTEIGFLYANGMLVGTETRENNGPPAIAARLVLCATYGRNNLVAGDLSSDDRENLERQAVDGYRLHQDGHYKDATDAERQRVMAAYYMLRQFRSETNRPRASVTDFMNACDEAVNLGLMRYNRSTTGRRDGRGGYRIGYCMPLVADMANDESDEEC